MGCLGIDQRDRFVERHRLGVGALRQSGVSRAVGDIGAEPALHDLQLLGRLGVRAKHRQRLAPRAPLAAAARRVGELGNGGVHAGLEHIGGG